MEYICKNNTNLLLSELIQIKELLRNIKIYYPESAWWFDNKVLQSENVIYLYVLNNKREMVAISILKNDTEKKIRSLYVKEDYRNLNIGIKLFEKAEAILMNDKPAFSFPDELENFYKKLCKNRNYVITKTKENYYRKGHNEYFVNYLEKHFEEYFI